MIRKNMLPMTRTALPKVELVNVAATNSATKSNSPQKPTLKNMDDLYSLYVQAQISYCPAAAFNASIQRRTEALEKYIKENNLDISDVKNLERFLEDVKENVQKGGLGMLGASQYRMLRFQDYIDNGYNPQMGLSRLKPTSEEVDDKLQKFLDVFADNQKLNVKEKEALSKLMDVNVDRAYRTFDSD